MSKPRLYLLIGKIVTFVWLSLAVIDFHLLTIYNHIIMKVIVIFFFVAFVDLYVKEIMGIINRIRNYSWGGSTIDGLSTQKIFRLLINSNWLPAKYFLENISPDKGVYKKLWDNLERVGVLIRWQKNARILNNQYTANQILNILNSRPQSDQLTTWLVQVWESSYRFINHMID